MKILVLGANGMLGHVVVLYLKVFSNIQVLGICGNSSNNNMFFKSNSDILINLNLLDFDNLKSEIERFKPNFVINCAVRKNVSDKTIIDDIYINSILPQKIASLTNEYNFKLIHISTDSIFGSYGVKKTEHSKFCIEDLYSATKILGEPIGDNTFTIRTSIVGHSIYANNGLLDYVLNSDKVIGYTNVFFAGTTVLELTKIIYDLIIKNNKLFGRSLYHICGPRISKFDLLVKYNSIYKLNLNLIKSDNIPVDRSISSNRFEKDFNYTPPTWDILLKELKIFHSNNKFIYAKQF